MPNLAAIRARKFISDVPYDLNVKRIQTSLSSSILPIFGSMMGATSISGFPERDELRVLSEPPLPFFLPLAAYRRCSVPVIVFFVTRRMLGHVREITGSSIPDWAI